MVLPALGMWAVAHANGEIHLRQLRAVTASAHKFPQDPAVIPSVDAHHPSAVIEVCWPRLSSSSCGDGSRGDRTQSLKQRLRSCRAAGCREQGPCAARQVLQPRGPALLPCPSEAAPD